MATGEDFNFTMKLSRCDDPCEVCPVRGKSQATLEAVGFVACNTITSNQSIVGRVYDTREALRQLDAPAEDLAAAVAAVAFKDAEICPHNYYD